jgi:hypothetical protein
MNQITLIFESVNNFNEFMKDVIQPVINKGKIVITDTPNIFVVKDKSNEK